VLTLQRKGPERVAFVNHATKTIAIKVVYYGPGLSGKTTNLRYIYSRLDENSRGELVCLETDTERTLFFDLLPVKAGLIKDYKVHFQLLTVPGQVFYEASRRSVLKGADGIIFVADSQAPLLDANLESFEEMRRYLYDYGIDLNLTPIVFQYNKRDLSNLIPVETFNNLLNPRGLPHIEAIAINGVGVLDSLKLMAKMVVPIIREKVFGEKRKEEPPVELVKEEKKEKPSAKPEEKKPKPKEYVPLRVTKIKLKSSKDVEEELERLAKEFASLKDE